MRMQYKLFDQTDENQNKKTSITEEKGNIQKFLTVDGLIYQSNFISKSQQQELVKAIYSAPWLSDIKRRVQHYGWKYSYKFRAIDYSMYLGELPTWAQNV